MPPVPAPLRVAVLPGAVRTPACMHWACTTPPPAGSMRLVLVLVLGRVLVLACGVRAPAGRQCQAIV